MDSGSQLHLAAAAFLATHFISSTPLRGVLVKAAGEKAYLALYSLLAFATLGWMIWAYNRAPLEPMWVGLRWLPAVVLPFAFILLACGLLSRNPTIVGAEKLIRSSDPARQACRFVDKMFVFVALYAAVGGGRVRDPAATSPLRDGARSVSVRKVRRNPPYAESRRSS